MKEKIAYRCPGCDVAVVGEREIVEAIIGAHRKWCEPYRNWWSEQQLQITLAKGTP